MNKINQIIIRKMEEQGINKYNLCVMAKIGTTQMTRLFKGLGINTNTLQTILDILDPGWEERFK